MTRAQGLLTLQRLVAEPLRGVVLGCDTDQGLMGYALLCSFWSNELGGEVCIVDEQPAAPSSSVAADCFTVLRPSAACRSGLLFAWGRCGCLVACGAKCLPSSDGWCHSGA